MAGADEKTVTAMGKCAYNIGIAFQIQDDILDIEGDEGACIDCGSCAGTCPVGAIAEA